MGVYNKENEKTKVKMENSNTLPKIEVGDTVIFRTDLVEGTRYNDILFANVQRLYWKDGKGVVDRIVNQEVFVIKGTHLLHSVGMVAQVIKPTKERMYALCELKKAIEFGCQQGHDRGHINLIEELRFIESLNK